MLLGPTSVKAIKYSLDQIEWNSHSIRKNKLSIFKHSIYNGYKQMGKPFNHGYMSECSKMCHSKPTMAKIKSNPNLNLMLENVRMGVLELL